MEKHEELGKFMAIENGWMMKIVSGVTKSISDYAASDKGVMPNCPNCEKPLTRLKSKYRGAVDVTETHIVHNLGPNEFSSVTVNEERENDDQTDTEMSCANCGFFVTDDFFTACGIQVRWDQFGSHKHD